MEDGQAMGQMWFLGEQHGVSLERTRAGAASFEEPDANAVLVGELRALFGIRVREPKRWCEYLPDVLVGEGGFEPPTSCSQSRCATVLRYSPFLLAPDLGISLI